MPCRGQEVVTRGVAVPLSLDCPMIRGGLGDRCIVMTWGRRVFFPAVLVRFLLVPLVHIYDIVLLGTFLYAVDIRVGGCVLCCPLDTLACSLYAWVFCGNPVQRVGD